MLSGQVSDAQVTGNDLFESRLQLFKVIMQDYRHSFGRSSVARRDLGSFLCEQTIDFMNRLLRRIISRDDLPEENNRFELLDFDFTNAQLMSLLKIMEEIEFRTEAMRAAKGRINVETEKNKKTKTDVLARAVVGEMFIPHVDQGMVYIRYVSKERINHPTFKSDLVVGLASFDFSVFLYVTQRASCSVLFTFVPQF